MAACEKCWRDANWRALHFGGSVTDHYHDLLRERKDKPCSEAEQRGNGYEAQADTERPVGPAKEGL